MAKVTLENRTTLVDSQKCRIHLEAGEHEVSADIEKALKDAGLIEVKKTIKKTEE